MGELGVIKSAGCLVRSWDLFWRIGSKPPWRKVGSNTNLNTVRLGLVYFRILCPANSHFSRDLSHLMSRGSAQSNR